jgi:hypothetical protein
VSILTAPSEYKNPFAPPAPAAVPQDAITPEAIAPTPTPAPAPAAPVAETPAAPAAPAAEVLPPSSEPARTGPAAVEPKAELKILPPEATKHVEHHWESDSFRDVASQAQPAREPDRVADVPPAGPRPRRDDRRNERPYFRSERERRDDRFAESRGAPGAPPRPPSGEFAPRETPPPAPAEAPKKSGGWFGWVKKLFGGSGAEKPASEGDTAAQREFGRGGEHRRRRRRGGRGRHFHDDQRGPRDGQAGGPPSGEPRGFGGEYRQHGRRRRHHHGGGDYRGGGRPEGGPPAGS